MIANDLRKACRAYIAAAPIEPRPCFKAQGLILGAGTVLAHVSEGEGVNSAGKDRLEALLATAYGEAIGAGTLGHTRQAVAHWSKGDHAHADLHLALSGLGPLRRPRDDSERPFLADALMEAGARSDMILSALGIAASTRGRANKFYNPGQPRVPAGNGRVSGQWASVARYLLQNLSREALLRLALIAARFSAPTVFLGVLFIPTNKTSPEEEYPVPGHPGLRVGRLVGETGWRIIYNDDQGDEQAILQQPDGTLHDPKGQIVGRVLPNGHVAIDLAAVAPDHVDEKEPRYCPAPVKDKYGGGPDSVARAYEDQVKHFVNPEAPTPSGWAVALPNPGNIAMPVTFDDCRHSTGAMIEAKGPTFTDLLRRAAKSKFLDSVDQKTLKQALNQIAAAGSREIQWYFADAEAAEHVRSLFKKFEGMSERIEIFVLPYKGPRR
ncbi:hypothetical protein [Phenylobacterium montanum]|uniref:Tox-REase-5 domain-containing protein n=1 Tax=Phenylobacterium montanum TaxID=2823693 RepID=A0A975G4B5_9CAUL|nr:hypothetical protein [Caulobacter sp. S6]QUD90544.1 hypothetical protein KCG34_12080 [Caulobacter sp. S6]